jgi:choline dehydrogenase-like flavoprotein
MRHFVDLFFVRPERELLQGELTKQVSFNDFYMNAGTKLGTVQSLGPMPPLDGALENFEISISQRWAGFSLAMPLVRPIIKLLTHNMSRALVYASILEDLPYAENRVTYDCIRSQICMSYRIHEEAWRRIRRFRALCLSAFTPLPVRLMKLAHIPWNIAHQVGTCRFGTSPKNSVLDRHCRAHELDNLFVLDGSFMPTSAGINPSLTIAANALRVAAEIGR